jgi:predicted site-specific integrase-resolvase
MYRIAIYVRVSTKDQSPDMQVRDLRTYCTARGVAISREYVDIGQSGAKGSHPELNLLMADRLRAAEMRDQSLSGGDVFFYCECAIVLDSPIQLTVI